MSSSPSASPTSSWGLGVKANSRGVAPAAHLDVVVVALARRHRRVRHVRDLEQRAPRAAASTSLSSASSVLMLIRDRAHLLAHLGRVLAAGAWLARSSSETRFRSALRSSTSANEPAALGVAGRASVACDRERAPPLSASARSTASGCSRISLRGPARGDPRGFRRGRRLSASTRAIEPTRSSASRSMMRTPIVLRPCDDTSSAWMRIILPLVVTTRMSSPSRTWSIPTTAPLRPAVLMSMMPLPGRGPAAGTPRAACACRSRAR